MLTAREKISDLPTGTKIVLSTDKKKYVVVKSLTVPKYKKRFENQLMSNDYTVYDVIDVIPLHLPWEKVFRIE